jgi:DNA-binding NarL/FixJ family response regulator
MNFDGKILLVDDEAHVRKYIGLILASTLTAPRIIEGSDGAEALETYQSEQPDLVLLDVNMPEQGGLETLRQIRAIDPDAVVIMLSSLTNRQTVEEALQLGAVNYIRKDTPRDEISAIIERTVAECFGDDV